MARKAELRYPVALAKISASRANGLPIERRIGRYVARAASTEAFQIFGKEVCERARDSLSSPLRILTFPHLRNSIASRIDGIDGASRDLIEGYLFQLIREGLIVRLLTISRSMLPYQGLYWHQDTQQILAAKESLVRYVTTKGYLSLNHAKRLIPSALAEKDQHVEILFGHLLYLGIASTDTAPTYPIETIRSPYVAPRL